MVAMETLSAPSRRNCWRPPPGTLGISASTNSGAMGMIERWANPLRKRSEYTVLTPRARRMPFQARIIFRGFRSKRLRRGWRIGLAHAESDQQPGQDSIDGSEEEGHSESQSAPPARRQRWDPRLPRRTTHLQRAQREADALARRFTGDQRHVGGDDAAGQALQGAQRDQGAKLSARSPSAPE